MKTELKVRIEKYFKCMVHNSNGDKDWVLHHMFGYLIGICEMGGFLHAGEFAIAQENLEDWYNQQE